MDVERRRGGSAARWSASSTSACSRARWTTNRTPARCRPSTSTHGSFHFGLGVRRAISRRNDFGTRIEFDNVSGKLFTALRALDYRHRFGPTFAAGFFFGAARYDALTPAYGWYGGAGVQWRDLWKNWDVGVDYRIGDHMVRNKTPSEPRRSSGPTPSTRSRASRPTSAAASEAAAAALAPLVGLERVLHQHRHGHRPDAARHRRDPAGARRGRLVLDVAHQLAVGAGG